MDIATTRSVGGQIRHYLTNPDAAPDELTEALNELTAATNVEHYVMRVLQLVTFIVGFVVGYKFCPFPDGMLMWAAGMIVGVPLTMLCTAAAKATLPDRGIITSPTGTKLIVRISPPDADLDGCEPGSQAHRAAWQHATA